MSYTYDEKSQTLTVGTGETAQTINGLPQDKYLGLKALGLDDATMIKFASTLGKLVKKQEIDAQAALIVAWEIDVNADPAIKSAYAKAASAFNSVVGGTKTKYAIDTLKIVSGQEEDGTFRFTSASSAKFDAMIEEFDSVRVTNNGEGWGGSFDCPDLYAKAKGANELYTSADALVDARKPKELGARMFTYDPVARKLNEKGKSGNGGVGGMTGRRVPIGCHDATGRKFDSAKAACAAFSWACKPTAEGIQNWHKVPEYLAAIKSGKLVLDYKAAETK